MAITLYDIPTASTKGNVWSPSTFKAKMALNLKGIPYKQEFIEYPDIEPFVKKVGGLPTGKKPDGSDYYTLPMIYDSKTDKYITESIVIVQYLDEQYPETPRLLPPGSIASISLLEQAFIGDVCLKIIESALIGTHAVLNPASKDFFLRTREQIFGKPWNTFSPPGPQREQDWANAKAGLAKFAGYFDQNGKGKPYFFGDNISYGDCVLAGWLLFFKVVSVPEEWKPVESWDDGRWAKLLEKFEPLGNN